MNQSAPALPQTPDIAQQIREDEAPLVALLEKNIEHMTEQELRDHLEQIRVLRGCGVKRNAVVKQAAKRTDSNTKLQSLDDLL